jgi:hypothetical protein
MAQGPDPNRWTPSDPEAREDEGLGVHERRTSTGLVWGIAAVVVVLAVVVLLLTA